MKRIDPEANLIDVEVELFGKEKSRVLRMALDTGSTYVIIHWDVAEISGYDPASSPEYGNITDYCLLSCHKPAISSANYPPVFETSLKTDGIPLVFIEIKQ